MQDINRGFWVQKSNEISYRIQQIESQSANQKTLEFTITQTINQKSIHDQIKKILFPSRDTIIVLQHKYLDQAEEARSSYILKIDMITKTQTSIKFNFIIRDFYMNMNRQDEIVFIDETRKSLNIYSLKECEYKKKIGLISNIQIKRLIFFEETSYACVIGTIGNEFYLYFYNLDPTKQLRSPFCKSAVPVTSDRIFKFNKKSMLGWQIDQNFKNTIGFQTFQGTQRVRMCRYRYVFNCQTINREISLRQNEFLQITKIQQLWADNFYLKVRPCQYIATNNQLRQSSNQFNNNNNVNLNQQSLFGNNNPINILNLNQPNLFANNNPVRTNNRNNNHNNNNQHNINRNTTKQYLLRADGINQKIQIFQPIIPQHREEQQNYEYKIENFQSYNDFSYFVVYCKKNPIGDVNQKYVLTIQNKTGEVINCTELQERTNHVYHSVFSSCQFPKVTHYSFISNSRIHIVSKLFCQYKVMYVHSLLKKNEDFDDDLLKDAMDLLQMSRQRINEDI